MTDLINIVFDGFVKFTAILVGAALGIFGCMELFAGLVAGAPLENFQGALVHFALAILLYVAQRSLLDSRRHG